MTNSLAPLRQGDLPLHRQAENSLRQLIANQETGLLPDELTLANRLGISRGTVRTAILRLVSEGVLERRAGIGTRVVQRSAESAISAWRSLSREMSRHGIQVQMFRFELCEVRAPRNVAEELHIPTASAVQRLDRVRGWNDLPVLRSRSWFHPRLKFAKEESFTTPLYDRISEISGLRAERAAESFVASAATVPLARDLRVKESSPLLLRRHTVFDTQGRPFEFAEIHYVSERFTLTLDLKRESHTGPGW
jgi:GntR family transcriptional regulator